MSEDRSLLLENLTVKIILKNALLKVKKILGILKMKTNSVLLKFIFRVI
jgi:hypothetical protein